MNLIVSPGDIASFQSDAIIVNVFEGVTEPEGATGAVDRAIGGMIRRLIADGELKGKLNETATIHVHDDMPFRKVIVVGLGPREDFDADRIRQAAATSVKAAAKGTSTRIATIVHGAGIGGMDPVQAARAVAEGALLGTYRFDRYKKDADTTEPETLVIVERDAAKVSSIQAGIDEGAIMAQSTNFARDLVNAPGNDMTPTAMAAAARQMAEETGLECTILDRNDMEQLGMGCLLGVACGSSQPPKLIVLRHPGAGDRDPIALVGKGVTFDTGGISLKPAARMAEMKSDMAGAAAVLGAMRAIALLQTAHPVIAIAACVENMPSGTALKPGDIVRGMTGTTVEVDNTDAEGRLVLADAVAYAESLGADRIVDVATLTGACIVALGDHYTGMIANDDALADAVIAAGLSVGEKHWRFPSSAEYKEQYKSSVADIKNTGGRQGGAITGGMIIGEFIREAHWVHLDIAGTSFSAKNKPYAPKGGTGVGVRTLAELVSRFA